MLTCQTQVYTAKGILTQLVCSFISFISATELFDSPLNPLNDHLLSETVCMPTTINLSFNSPSMIKKIFYIKIVIRRDYFVSMLTKCAAIFNIVKIKKVCLEKLNLK